MRYGENPHQSAAFYVGPEPRPGVATARQLQGKELSYNNINDTDAAYELVAEFDAAATAAVAIIKHANPCGAAIGATLLQAYEKALACDPVSAYGGIVALNRKLDAAAAKKIVEIFTEVIIAPDADEEAIKIVATKKNLRLLIAGALPDPQAPTLTVRSVAGGLLVQERDNGVLDRGALKSRHGARADRGRDARPRVRLAGLQARQVERDRLCQGRRHRRHRRRPDEPRRFGAHRRHEIERTAGPGTAGSVVASDAFFPFADGLVAAVEAGATAVIQPGGSVRDNEVIAAADAAGVAMVFTGMRHFRH